jgi:hypothetical protein
MTQSIIEFVDPLDIAATCRHNTVAVPAFAGHFGYDGGERLDARSELHWERPD